MICQQCGIENEGGKKFCGDCGTILSLGIDAQSNENGVKENEELETPNSTTNESIQNNSNVKTTNKKRIAVLLGAIVSLLIIVSIIGVYFYNKNQATKYETDLKNVVIEILDQSSKAENVVDTYSDVWKKVIESDYSNRVVIKGQTVYDFSTGLRLQREVFNDDGSIAKMKSGKSSIKLKMKSLNQPPEKYKDAYNIAFELYGYYTEYEALAESPSGSLVTFNQKTGELSSQIVKKINEFEVKIPIK